MVFQSWSRRPMEGGGRTRFGRLLHRLRGEHRYSIDKASSFCSTAMSESTGCGSMHEDEDFIDPPIIHAPHSVGTEVTEEGFADNIDLRYAGQYLTPEQLPAFCTQLHHLVEVVRNIQAYAHVTGEYPTELEQRLEREAREVAALAAETRNARDVIQRTRVQRRALQDHARELRAQLASLKDIESRELESTVRMSDRKLYKSWEAVRDASEPAAFEPLLDEIRSKQNALDCLLRLIESRRSSLAKCSTTPHPLPPPLPPPVPRDSRDRDSNDEPSTMSGVVRKRHERRAARRRRKEPRSVPLSSEPSAHTPPLPQVTLYIQGSETASRRAGSASVTPLDLPSGGSVRDILFFTTNTG